MNKILQLYAFLYHSSPLPVAKCLAVIIVLFEHFSWISSSRGVFFHDNIKTVRLILYSNKIYLIMDAMENLFAT